jgi:hypothetical protein
MTQPIAYQPYPPANPWHTDLSHLKTLAICHYVWGALTILLSSIFIVHIVMGVVLLKNPGAFNPPRPATTAPMTQQPQMPPAFGWIFVGAGSCAMLLGWSAGILTIISGRCLARRRARLFSLIMAGVNCLSVPIGTTLGVFTFVLLLRPSVQALYDQSRPAATG